MEFKDLFALAKLSQPAMEPILQMVFDDPSSCFPCGVAVLWGENDEYPEKGNGWDITFAYTDAKREDTLEITSRVDNWDEVEPDDYEELQSQIEFQIVKMSAQKFQFGPAI